MLERHGLRPTELSLAYFVGFFDGEGCVIITNRRVRLSIEHTYPQVLESIQKSFGGKVYGPRFKKGKKPIYSWRLGITHQVTHLLKQMLPLLREKRWQAELAIDWEGTLPGGEKRRALKRLAQEAKRIEHYKDKDTFD